MTIMPFPSPRPPAHRARARIDGREYFFKTREEFEQMIEHDELVEYAQYVGNYYGTPKEYVFSNLKAGKDVLLRLRFRVP